MKDKYSRKNKRQKIAWTALLLQAAFPLAALAQPANDEPCGALSIPVNTSGYYCPSAYSSSTAAATGSAVPAAPSCSGNTGDVWFKFVAQSAAHRIHRSNISPVVAGSFINPGMAVYSGSACSSLSEISCTTQPTVNLSGLTIGNTYYVRVWTAAYSGNPQFNFDLCIGTAPGIPANDACVNAISLNDGNLHSVYSNNATESMPAYDCGAGASATGALDVWYKVTAASNGPIAINANGYESYINVEAYASCGSATPVYCTGDAPAMLTLNATAGNTYYLRLYGREGSGYMTIQASGTAPLPVVTNELRAVLTAEKNVLLNWEAMPGQEGSTEIERAIDGKHFQTIGSVVPVKNKSTENRYTFSDSLPLGQNYYRLNQVDKDGLTRYSNIAFIKCNKERQWRIAPNPSTGLFAIEISTNNKEINGQLTVTDATGKIIRKLTVSNKKIIIDLSKALPGAYYLKYTDRYGILEETLVKE